MFENNYVLRDKRAMLRQAFVAWVGVTLGSVVFIMLAVLLTLQGASPGIVFVVGALVTTPVLVAWYYYSYRTDMRDMAAEFVTFEEMEAVRNEPGRVEEWLRLSYGFMKSCERKSRAHLRALDGLDVFFEAQRIKAQGDDREIARIDDLVREVADLRQSIRANIADLQASQKERALQRRVIRRDVRSISRMSRQLATLIEQARATEEKESDIKRRFHDTDPHLTI